MTPLRARLVLLARLCLIVLCILYLVTRMDWGATAETFANYEPLRILVVVAFALAILAVPGLRLHLLSREPVGPANGVMAGLIGQGVNNLVPARLGEVAKTLFLRKRLGWPFSRALALVFWERFLDANCLVLLAISALTALEQRVLLWPAAALLGLLWTTVLCAIMIRPRFSRWSRWLHGRLGMAYLGDLAGEIGAGFRSYRLLGGASLSLGLWVLYVVSTWLALVWIARLSIGPVEVLAVFVCATLGLAVPIAPGALGVFETTVVLSLGWFGIPKEEALPAALLLRLTHLVPSTVVGLSALAVAGVGWNELRRAPRSVTEAGHSSPPARAAE